MKKDKNPETIRNYKLSHQVLCITSINFFRQSLIGFVELTILPQNNELRKIKLNCKQCRVYKILVNEHEAVYTYSDPTMEITKTEAKQRNLNFFSVNHLAAATSVDADHGNGEVAVRIPPDVIPLVRESKSIKVTVEFSLEKPQGGIHFVVPDMDATLADRGAHMFTYGHENSSRLWFPCVDTFSEPCTWKMEFTVDSSMTAVSCGDLIDTVFTPDLKKKTFHYQLSIPTSAPNIGLAVGPFEIYVDPLMHEVTNFCLPRLLPILKNTTGFIHEAFEFYEELLSSRYPFSCYKQVFIDEAYVDAAPYSTMTLLNTNILHSNHIIDQTFTSRKIMTWAVAVQFFGCFISMYSWSDVWITKGIAMYLAGQYIKKAFGNNEYRYWVDKSREKVIKYEQDYGSIVLDCHAASDKDSGHYFPTKHLHTTSPKYNEVLAIKAHIVIRMLEIRLGRELLLQVFNKLLSLAGNAAQQKISSNLWYNMVVSTSSFQKAIFTVTGKDIETFREMWISEGGHAKFQGSFVFNRKRNIVELEIRQPENLSQGLKKYVGPLVVSIQELDGTFHHTLQIEENICKHDITCHSKSRRNKKKKIPLVTGEEVDMNLDAMDQDSPVLWIRIDPDIQLMREVVMEQPDFQWQYQLRYERDVTAQLQAIEELIKYPTPASRLALTDTIENEKCNIRVRCAAAMCLRDVANKMKTWTGPPAMMAIFRKFFGCHSCPHIVRQNNFSHFQQYFLQKTIPLAMAGLRTQHENCPQEVIRFLLDLFKYNDNSKNTHIQFSDNYYRAALIDALSNTVTLNLYVLSDGARAENLSPEMKQVIDEITRFLNLEKLLNSYHNTVTVSCLKAVRNLQKMNHVPGNFNFFRPYSVYGIYVDVRLAAFEMMVDHVKCEGKEEELQHLLEVIETDPVPYVRFRLLQMLTANPPFTSRSANHPLNSVELVERLWKFMNQSCFYDSRIRCAAVDLFHSLYGQSRPSCLPSNEFSKFTIPQRKSHIDIFPPLAELEPARSRSPLSSCVFQIDPTFMEEDNMDHQDIIMEAEQSKEKWNDSDVKVKVETLWNSDFQVKNLASLNPSSSSDDSMGPPVNNVKMFSEDSLSKSLPAIQGGITQQQPLGFEASMFKKSPTNSHDDPLRFVHKDKKKKKKKNKHKHRHKHKEHNKKSSGGSSNSLNSPMLDHHFLN